MNLTMTWKTILILFFASLLYVLPLYLFAQTHTLSWRLDSDYDSMWSSIEYPLMYLHTHHVFPKEHIYAGLGLPIRGDPFFQLYDPVALIPFFFLGLEKGMWLIVILTVFFSGVTMYFFVRSFSVSRQIALWGGLLYMFSGGLVAKVAAGHLIFLLTYPLWPLFFRVLMEPFFGKKSYILLAATIVLTFFHGDLYGLIFMAIFYFSSRLFFFLRKRHRWYHFVFQTLLLGDRKSVV